MNSINTVLGCIEIIVFTMFVVILVLCCIDFDRVRVDLHNLSVDVERIVNNVMTIYNKMFHPKKFCLLKYRSDLDVFTTLDEALEYEKFLDNFQRYDITYLRARYFITMNSNKIVYEILRVYVKLFELYPDACTTNPFKTVRSNKAYSKNIVCSFEDVCYIVNNCQTIAKHMKKEIEKSCPEKLKMFNTIFELPLECQDKEFVDTFKKHWEIVKLVDDNVCAIKDIINQFREKF